MLTPWKNHCSNSEQMESGICPKFLLNPHLKFPFFPNLCASPCFEASLLAVPEFGLGHQVSKNMFDAVFLGVFVGFFLRGKQHCLILLFTGKFKGTPQSHGTFAF